MSTEAELQTHHLKTVPQMFERILSGRKKAELRYNDRGFKSGDELVLEEWIPGTAEYTGRRAVFYIADVLTASDIRSACRHFPDWPTEAVILSIEPRDGVA